MKLPVKVNPKYRHLSKEELLETAYKLGGDYEMHSFSCSQSTAAAIHEIVKMDDCVVRCATTSCAGSASEIVGECGGYAGGLIVLDYFFGRDAEYMSYTETKDGSVEALNKAQDVAREYFHKYVEQYGTIHCAMIQQKLYGRFYYLCDPDELQKFNDQGAHNDPTKCRHIVGSAAKMILEILIDKGAVEVGK